MWPVTAAFLLFFGPDHGAVGIKALEAKQYETAAQQFTLAVQADPADYYAHFNLGYAYSLLGKDADAVAEYKKVLELKSGLYQAQLNLGIILLNQQHPAEALVQLRAASEQKPKEFRPRLFLSEALLATGDAGAEESFRLAAELDPKSAAAELGWARAQAKQKKWSEAAGHFRRVIEIDKDRNDALLELASIYEAGGQGVEAIPIYRQFPDNIAAQERLGELLVEATRYDEAIPILEKVIAKDATPANRLALAESYRRTKQMDKAVPLLESIIAGDPGNFDLRLRFGRLLKDEKQFARATQHLLAAAQRKPDSQEVWKELGSSFYKLENYPQALDAFTRAHNLGDETPGNYYFRAIILDKMHQLDRRLDLKPALENYRKFLALNEGKPSEEEFQARHAIIRIQKELSRR